MYFKTCMASLLVCFCLLLNSCFKKPQEVDLILLNGNIHTLNKRIPKANALVSNNGKIIDIGSNTIAKKYLAKKTIDLKGSTVYPGFHEGHGHFISLGAHKRRLALNQTQSFNDLIEKVEESAKNNSSGTWIIGQGWHQDKWKKQDTDFVAGFPVHTRLSKHSPNHPVYLVHANGHSVLVNQKALKLLKAKHPDLSPYKKEIIWLNEGSPSGIFSEKAMALFKDILPAEALYLEQDFLKAQKIALENGITSFHDAGTSTKQIQIFKQMLANGTQKIRLYPMLSLESFLESGSAQPFLDQKKLLNIRSIKLLADGALGSRTAKLLKPYTDAPKQRGLRVSKDEIIQKTVEKALQLGFQVNTHAIGDEAVQKTLNIYENMFQKYPKISVDHRFRIEHAQHIDPQDIPRFATLKIIPSMQAIHLSSDRSWAIKRLGKKRIEAGAYVWRKLMNSGSKIVNGTDVPVEPISPIENFYAAITRKTLEGFPPEGYESSQIMTREEALESITKNAAYASFSESYLGSIEMGKETDLTVTDLDLLSIEETRILETRILFTIIAGEIVYENKTPYLLETHQ